jgi:DNA-binding transcriptional regulator YiaG
MQRADALMKEIVALRKEVSTLVRGRGVVPTVTSKAANTSENIRVLRRSLGLSQHQLGLLTGVSTQAVYLWERKGGALRLRHQTRRALHGIRVSSPARIHKQVRALENGKG